MDDHKAGTKRALENYLKKQEPKATVTRGPVGSPEKEVEKECLAWMREQNWNVQIYESKATYNPGAGRYISQNMKAGTADCMGTLPQGIAVVVEFKAPKKVYTFAKEKNYRQQEFVERMIASGAFVCITDSAARLYSIYNKWEAIRRVEGIEPSKTYLRSMVPKAKRRKNSALNDLGF